MRLEQADEVMATGFETRNGRTLKSSGVDSIRYPYFRNTSYHIMAAKSGRASRRDYATKCRIFSDAFSKPVELVPS
jgi:hypothetical protein